MSVHNHLGVSVRAARLQWPDAIVHMSWVVCLGARRSILCHAWLYLQTATTVTNLQESPTSPSWTWVPLSLRVLLLLLLLTLSTTEQFWQRDVAVLHYLVSIYCSHQSFICSCC